MASATPTTTRASRITHNAKAIRAAIAGGFTLNVSADGLEHAEELASLGVAPVVTVLAADTTSATTTSTKRSVVVCPASIREFATKPAAKNITCATCGVCQIDHRKSIIGFPAHGVSQKRAEKVFWLNTVP